MALSKLEMQQMLREMNVKFDADETTAQLKHRLQQAHHNMWLKSLSGGRSAIGGAGKQLIKKKHRQAPALPDTHPNVSAASDQTHPSPSPGQGRSGRADRPFRPRPIDKPSPGQPWKAAGVGTEPFNRKKNVFASVIKRAKGCCERCGRPFADDADAGQPTLFYIDPLDQGGDHSIKNVVALCQACLLDMQADPTPKAIKALKRRARAKLYDALKVVRKKSRAHRKAARKPPR